MATKNKCVSVQHKSTNGLLHRLLTKRSFSSFLFVICLMLPITSQAITEPWQKRDFIINSFFEIALGSEYGGAALKVRKWGKPINIYVDHQVGDNLLHDELLNAHISDLRKITGLKINRVKSKSKANIQYFFTSQKKLPGLVRAVSGKKPLKHLSTAVCMATMHANGDSSIRSAVVYIPVDQARMHAKLVSCIVEELTQVLGLPRDSDEVFPSVFNDHTKNELLTGLDITLLKLLYNPKIKAGMGKRQLRPILKKVISKMRQRGELKKASKASRKLALCKYMDC